MNVFITFLLSSYALTLLAACLGNYITGVAKGIQDGQFDFKKALIGLRDLILLGIGYLVAAVFAFMVQGIVLEDIQIFSALFTFLTVLIIAYRANSLLKNFAYIAKIPLPKVFTTIDDMIKAKIENAKPSTVFTGVVEADLDPTDAG